jgi:hypothetical protein
MGLHEFIFQALRHFDYYSSHLSRADLQFNEVHARREIEGGQAAGCVDVAFFT